MIYFLASLGLQSHTSDDKLRHLNHIFLDFSEIVRGFISSLIEVNGFQLTIIVLAFYLGHKLTSRNLNNHTLILHSLNLLQQLLRPPTDQLINLMMQFNQYINNLRKIRIMLRHGEIECPFKCL